MNLGFIINADNISGISTRKAFHFKDLTLSDLIIQVDGALQANSRLILTKKPDNEEVHSNEVTDSSTIEDQTMQENA